MKSPGREGQRAADRSGHRSVPVVGARSGASHRRGPALSPGERPALDVEEIRASEVTVRTA